MRLSAEMPRLRPVGPLQIPFMHLERLVPALDHEPVNRIRFHNPANLTLKLFQCAHSPENHPFPRLEIIAARSVQLF